MSFVEWKVLSGTCEVVLNGTRIPYVLCDLDFSERRLICTMDSGTDASSTLLGGKAITVENLVLNAPSGPLTASVVNVAFAAHVSGPTWTIDQTVLGHALGVRPQTVRLKLLLNEPLKLQAIHSGVEWMFNGEMAATGPIEVCEGFTIVGGRHYVSAIGGSLPESKRLVICMGLILGAPVEPIVIHQGFEVSVILNNFEKLKERSLVIDSVASESGEWKNPDAFRKNAADLCRACLSYMSKLDDASFAKFSNAVSAFLQTRSARLSLELTILGAFYFLEWLDETRRLSENVIAQVLQIQRREADVLKMVRDDLVHNRKLLISVIDGAVQILRSIPNASFERFDNESAHYSFLNYLMTLLTEALLRRVEYSGKAKSYLPISLSDR